VRTWEAGQRRAACLTFYAVCAGLGLVLLAALSSPPVLNARWLTTFALLLGLSMAATGFRGRRTGWTAALDAGFVIELCALVLVGPLGALAVAYLPDLADRLVHRERLRAVSVLGNLAANVCECGLGALVLTAAPAELTTFSALPAVFTAGFAMGVAGYLVAPLTYGALYEGRGLAASMRPLLEGLPVQLLMVLCGALAVLATGYVGVLALVLIAGAAQAPQLLAAGLGRVDDVRSIEPAAATRIYAAAIADVMRLPRDERKVMDAGLALLAGQTPTHASSAVLGMTETVLYRDERWDGGGECAGLAGAWIPLASRVIAVAAAWSELTARGTLELAHHEAILGMSSQAGTRFDPEVVAAAAAVVELESLYAKQPAFVPGLHRLPLPRSLRHGPLPRVLRLIASA
jgi:HD domain-containing protein